MKRLFAAAAVVFASLSLHAEVKNGIEHAPLSCVRGGELPLLQVKTAGPGELRGYFRRINTTDWCSTEGTNEGPLSRVVLPKFDNGDEIEYFFVLLDGTKVIGRSDRIYRTRVTAACESAFARHLTRLTMSCGDDDIPAGFVAGIAMGDELVKGNPPRTSPDRPEPQRQP